MNMLDRDKLLEMVVDAYRACKSENMPCPWCSGQIGADTETHDESCLWVEVYREKLAIEYLARMGITK